VLSHAAADAEVIRVDHRAFDLGLLAFDAEVRDPVLTAAVRTAGDVDLQMLIEARHPRFQLFDQPAREALGLGEGELAEFGARARDGPAPERRGLDPETGRLDLSRELIGLLASHVQDQ